jgi:gamma-glutamylcyclotransferase (GGCT)/AIG2-like uncharacterized protein YtfP
MKRYYLAYGSNLNLNQMRRRCPNARKVGSFLLKGYELEFRYYLTINKNQNAEVPLGIFEIDEKDELSLDRYEGYPTHYRKEYLEVELNGKPIKALVYIMNEDIRGVMIPDIFYLRVCLEGYKDFGFDTTYLFKAYKEAE